MKLYYTRFNQQGFEIHMALDLTLFESQIVSTDQKLTFLIDYLKKHHPPKGKIVLISDNRVFPLHGETLLESVRQAGFQIEPIILPAGESSKRLSSAEQCWNKMHSFGLDRTSLVIGLGGGVITDLTGFVASCYMRGIANILIPTTLMGMIDAAIGGKTAVNLESGKNLVGTFYQPKKVLIVPFYLDTLPPREFHSGLAEVIKSAVLWDNQFFQYLEENLERILKEGPKAMDYLIEHTVAIKVCIVQQDEKEKGVRAFLNWGHTFAHALETITQYKIYLHGEAVSIGMCCGAFVSQEFGLVDHEFIQRQEKLLSLAQLPIRLPNDIAIDQLIDLMEGDKKSVGGKINLILARKIGQVDKFDNVKKATIKKALLKMKE